MGQLVYECMCIFLGNYRGKRAIHSYTNELSSIVFDVFLHFLVKNTVPVGKIGYTNF